MAKPSSSSKTKPRSKTKGRSKPRQGSLLHRLQRIFNLVRLLAVLLLLLIVGRAAGYALPGLENLTRRGSWFPAGGAHVALILGHAGSDTGAICTDPEGRPTLTEAAITREVGELVAQKLRRAGAQVTLLEEYDPRLEGLQADLLLSLHADSCIDASGYKAARSQESRIPQVEDRILACIDREYSAATGLPAHPNTVTHNMTLYHAFRRVDPETPAAILEMGFLGGDQALLTEHPETVARGVVESILCFLNPEEISSSP